MSRTPAWVLPLLAGVLAIAIAVTTALAAGQPAASQPQTVRFITQFVTFAPKDPAAMGDGSDPRKAFTRLDPVNLEPATQATIEAPDGHTVRRPLEDLAVDLGPFDVFKSEDPKAIEAALTRIDDRWDYHVLTLSGSGAVGDLLAKAGQLGPLTGRARPTP